MSLAADSWRDRALCAIKKKHPDDFFPDGKFTRNCKDYRLARQAAQDFCTRCEVREDCLAYALQNDIRDGIWGGLTPSARLAIRYPDAKKNHGRVIPTDFPPPVPTTNATAAQVIQISTRKVRNPKPQPVAVGAAAKW